jgi:hypothetical protein
MKSGTGFRRRHMQWSPRFAIGIVGCDSHPSYDFPSLLSNPFLFLSRSSRSAPDSTPFLQLRIPFSSAQYYVSDVWYIRKQALTWGEWVSGVRTESLQIEVEWPVVDISPPLVKEEAPFQNKQKSEQKKYSNVSRRGTKPRTTLLTRINNDVLDQIVLSVPWTIVSSGIWHREVCWNPTDVSRKYIISIYRIEEWRVR